MISVIICSRNEELFSKVAESIERTIGLPFEIIKIDNHEGKMGICEAYNRAASMAKFHFLCFCHEDLIFHTTGWGAHMLRHLSVQDTGLIGVVGSTIKTKAPSGIWLDHQMADRLSMVQGTPDGSPYFKYQNPLNETASEVKLIDGLFMACRKEVWAQFRFDEQSFKGFHGYDIDFSLQISQEYKLYVVYDIQLQHLSEGNYSTSWIESMIELTKKWKAKLPTHVKGLDATVAKELEARNYYRFLRLMAKKKKFDKHAYSLFFESFVAKPNSLNHLKLIKLLFSKN